MSHSGAVGFSSFSILVGGGQRVSHPVPSSGSECVCQEDSWYSIELISCLFPGLLLIRASLFPVKGCHTGLWRPFLSLTDVRVLSLLWEWEATPPQSSIRRNWLRLSKERRSAVILRGWAGPRARLDRSVTDRRDVIIASVVGHIHNEALCYQGTMDYASNPLFFYVIDSIYSCTLSFHFFV